LFNGHAARTCFAMREDIVSRSTDQEWNPPKDLRARAHGRPLSGYETATDKAIKR
jgi:hypothetical protein